jgi:hypothetical protein
MVDVRILDEDVIADLHSRGVIRFTKRYEMKMRDRLMKRENKV